MSQWAIIIFIIVMTIVMTVVMTITIVIIDDHTNDAPSHSHSTWT